MIEFFLSMKKIPTTTHQQKQVAVVNGKPQFYEPPKLKEARHLFSTLLAPYTPKSVLKKAKAFSTSANSHITKTIILQKGDVE